MYRLSFTLHLKSAFEKVELDEGEENTSTRFVFSSSLFRDFFSKPPVSLGNGDPIELPLLIFSAFCFGRLHFAKTPANRPRGRTRQRRVRIGLQRDESSRNRERERSREFFQQNRARMKDSSPSYNLLGRVGRLFPGKLSLSLLLIIRHLPFSIPTDTSLHLPCLPLTDFLCVIPSDLSISYSPPPKKNSKTWAFQAFVGSRDCETLSKLIRREALR